MKRNSKFALLAIGLAVWSFGLTSAVAHEGHHNAEAAPNPIHGESIFNLSSKWTSQNEKLIRLKDLRGRPAILAMVYTSCESACPLIIEDLKKIEKKLSLSARQRFSILLFSFDSKRDTPKRLKAYGESRKLDLNRWALYHGAEHAVRELAAVLGIRFKRETNGGFGHSNVITLIDSEGLVQYQQLGLNQDPSEFLLKAEELSSK